MASKLYNQLSPLPFIPVYGKFDLNTYVQGSSDYEIMARVIETYNNAVKLFNEIIGMYSDIDQTIDELTQSYEQKLQEYEQEINNANTAFQTGINNTIQNQNTTISNFQTATKQQIQAQDTKIAQLNDAIDACQEEINKLLEGEYIENYVQALATWIDNNLQVMVQKVVKYVWFELDDSGYFIAWIPDTWDFITFDTDMNPDSEDYGKLALLWQPNVVD